MKQYNGTCTVAPHGLLQSCAFLDPGKSGGAAFDLYQHEFEQVASL
jgi:hypothetical protein